MPQNIMYLEKHVVVGVAETRPSARIIPMNMAGYHD